jgi:hypothetical protein
MRINPRPSRVQMGEYGALLRRVRLRTKASPPLFLCGGSRFTFLCPAILERRRGGVSRLTEAYDFRVAHFPPFLRAYRPDDIAGGNGGVCA